MTNWGTENPFGSEQPETPPMTYGTPAGGNYGYPPSSSGTPGNHPSGPPKSKGQSNTLATLSLIFAFVLPPAGAVLGHLALSQIKKHPQPGRRQAVIGTILSYAMTVILVVVLVVWLVLGRDDTESASASAVPTTAPSTRFDAQIVLPFTGLATPRGLAVAADGTVYVADFGNSRVWYLSPGSSTQAVLPIVGPSEPWTLAVGADGTVYVSDPDAVVRGLRLLSVSPGSSSQIELPAFSHVVVSSVAVGDDGTIYVTYPSSHGDSTTESTTRHGYTVASAAPGSAALAELSFAGVEASEETPRVAVDADGTVYVTDVKNDRVLSLARGSTSPAELPFAGLRGPTGIAVGTDGTVYVADKLNRVLSLDRDGTQTELPFTELRNPTDVAVDADGAVYVIDFGNKRVVKLPAA